MKKTIFLFVILFTCRAAFAQIDTLFWFAAPDISSAFNYDRPIYLRISSFQQPCSITISQPANGGLPTQTFLLAPNTMYTVDLTAWINSIEGDQGNIIQNKGLKIHSDNKIAVYYEVNGNGPNPELFALKGKNALGTQFYVSSQTLLNNTATHVPTPTSSFNIVATEDNTQVTINPTKDIVGHVSGTSFTISLNKGQTYAAIATCSLASQHLNGSFVSSTKPIAITISDDLLKGTAFGGICEDLAGDQTVPWNVIGNEYIAIRSNLNSPYDKVYMMATANATIVTQDGVNIGTLNAGQTVELSLNSNYSYIQTSAPAYAYQLAGIGCEVGAQILPKINCTGSSSVSVARSTIESFIVTILVKNGGQNNFLVNNLPGIVTAASFNVVPGTGNQWYAAKVNLPLASYPNGSVIKITNSTHLFQLGVLQGGVNSGTGVGYFSDFNSIAAHSAATDPNPCVGNQINLFADTLVSGTYSWTGPNGYTSSLQNPVINNASILNSGNYVLKLTAPGCGSYLDTIKISVKSKTLSTINLSICQGQSYHGYVNTGIYIDTLAAVNGCDSIRTLNLTVLPKLFTTVTATICQGKSYSGYNSNGIYIDTLVSTGGCDSIRTLALTVKPRSFSTITQTICQGQTYLGHATSGIFTDTLIASNGCDSIRTLNLTVKSSKFSTINQSLCQGQSYLGYTSSGTFKDTLIATNGCDSIRTLNLIVIPKLLSTINQTICAGKLFAGYGTSGIYKDTFVSAAGCDSIRTLNLTVAAKSFSTITKSICQGEFYAGYNSGGKYIDTLINAQGCDSIRTLNLTVKPPSFSSISQTICQGQSFLGYFTSGIYKDTLRGVNTCDSIRTLNLKVLPFGYSIINQSICDGQTYLGYSKTGTYIDTLVATNGCDSVRRLNLLVMRKPVPNLGADTGLCRYQTLTLSPGLFNTYLWQNGSTKDHLDISAPGTYSVTVTNVCGSAIDNILIRDAICDIYFPNSFTPNMDGKNDVFRILGAYDLKDYKLYIYNRYGQKVFETSNYLLGWAGTINGVNADLGTYVWYCEFLKLNGRKKMKGSVILIR